MIKVILSDLAYVILFPKDKDFKGTLSHMYSLLSPKKSKNFWDYYNVDQEYLDYIKTFSDSASLYVFTTGAIQYNSELNKLLRKYFIDIIDPSIAGYEKSSEDAYKFICNELKVLPQDVLFIDDKPWYIDAAKRMGINAIRYTGLENLKEHMARYF